MCAPLFSPEQREQFARSGILRLRAGFPAEAARHIEDLIWGHLESRGILKADDSTWRREPWRIPTAISEHPAFAAVGSERLSAAITELLGHSSWRFPRNLGNGLFANPPDLVQGEWRVPSVGWHWDGKWTWPHESLWCFPLYGRLTATGGGTLLLAGSGALLDTFYQRLTPQDRQRSQAHLRKRFLSSHPYLRELTGQAHQGQNRKRFLAPHIDEDGNVLQVVPVSGEAGDVVLCHPHILHVKPPHHGEAPRFLSIRGVSIISDAAGPWGGRSA